MICVRLGLVINVMNVYLTHVENDQLIADELAGRLKLAGFVKPETGATGFRPLQSTDVVVALWSKNTQFSVHRLQIEKRILEAWSESRLVLVKLDHHFLPVGLRDLDFVDATFEAARKTGAWMKIQREVRAISERARRGIMPMETEVSFSGSAGTESLMDDSADVSDEMQVCEAPPSPAPPARAAKVDADEPEKSLVFVSYSHSDSGLVTKLVEIVKENGRTVWIDKAGITPGESWAGEIVRAIKAADGVVVMCSPRAFESDHIKREIYLADRYRKPMLPVFIEAAEPPEDFEYFFAGVQHLRLFDWEESDYSKAFALALEAI